ncbi:AAA family ATPase [Paraburkholderia sp. JPY419]|uniref:AAA family ATPase n=1 Tax=Paraburkholderia sp. JPY419 TaxID=667660 RepID=UPI003D1C33C5
MRPEKKPAGANGGPDEHARRNSTAPRHTWQAAPGGNGQQRPATDGEPGETYYVTERLDQIAQRAVTQRWFVRGVVPDESVIALFGASGSGKTFLGLDLGLAIACKAHYWFGHGVDPAPILLLALEGEGGLQKRVQAWHTYSGENYPLNFRVLRGQPFDLRSPADMQALIERAHADGMLDGLVMIDTLNRATPALDENSGAEMSVLIQNCAEIRRQLGGSVLLICHSGKDSSKGIRGHSSLIASLDAAIEVVRNEDGTRQWRMVKAKDDIDGVEHAFRLKIVQVGEDEDGEPLTSCAVEPLDEDALRPRRPRPRGPGQVLAYRAIGALLRASREFGKADAPPTRPCVLLDAAVEEVVRHMVTCAPRSRPYVARRAVQTMVAARIYGCADGWLWCL